MAIWKIDQFHPLALLSACTAGLSWWRLARLEFQNLYFQEKTLGTQDNMLALPLKIEGMLRAGIVDMKCKHLHCEARVECMIM